MPLHCFLHFTHVRSLPVSTAMMNFFAGDPICSSARYNPIPAYAPAVMGILSVALLAFATSAVTRPLRLDTVAAKLHRIRSLFAISLKSSSRVLWGALPTYCSACRWIRSRRKCPASSFPEIHVADDKKRQVKKRRNSDISSCDCRLPSATEGPITPAMATGESKIRAC